MEPKLFTIPGSPIALMRPRFSKGHVFDAQKDVKFAWSVQLRQQYRGEMFSGPIRLEITFYLPMAKTKVRQHDLMRGTYHVYKPDLSNLIKFVEDCAMGIIFEDDCIISEIVSKKIYDDQPRTEFTIIELIKEHLSPEDVAAKVKRQVGGRHHNGSTRGNDGRQRK